MRQAKIQKKYFRRAKITAAILQLVPFVRLVGLNGSLARGEAKETSDIDFLIIAKKGKIWTCRAFVTILAHATGLRRYGKKIAGRICLNRYQTDDFLEILPHNAYHARVFSQLIPLLDIKETYVRYMETNGWMKKFGWPVNIFAPPRPNRIINFYRERAEQLLSGGFGRWLEKTLKKYQINRIKRDIRTLTASIGRVRISDQELCFHPRKT